MRTCPSLFVGGQWIEPASTDVIQVTEAHSERAMGEVPDAGGTDVDRAVVSARRAFDQSDWPHLPVAERVAAVRRVVDQFTARAEEMAADHHLGERVTDQVLPARPGGGGGGHHGVDDRSRLHHGVGGAPDRSLPRLPAPARAGRRGRGHRGLERPPGAHRHQAGAGAAGRMHGGGQGGPRGVVGRGAAGRDRRRRRAAAGHGVRPHRRGRGRPGPGRPPRCRQDRLHRLDRRRS